VADQSDGPKTVASIALRLALVAIPAWLTFSLLVFHVSWATKLLIAIVVGVSIAAPAWGLLLVAVLAPLGRSIAPFIGPPNFRVSEAVIVAFLVGWAIRAVPDRRGPRVPAAGVAWLFAVAVMSSVAGLAWQMRVHPGALTTAVDLFAHAYYFIAGDSLGAADAARLLEGLALVSATVMLFRQRPSLAETLPCALAVPAAIAALTSVLEWRRVGGYRVSGHVADVNAAGSYFALILCVALGMTWHARGRRQALWAAATVAAGVGLWFSESRTALVAVSLVLLVAATWFVVAPWKAAARAAVISAMLLAGIGVAAFRIHQVNFGVDYREQFYATSARMIATRPLFGIGVGQYFTASVLFLSPQLAWNYGFENAHNNFLQIGAELGLVGLGLFVVWLAAGFRRAIRALAIAPRDPRLLGITAGAAAFVITWTGSHPLLVGEVAFPFWIQFGLMVALAGSTILTRIDRPGTQTSETCARASWPPSAIAGLVGIAATIAIATIAVASQPITPPSSRDVNGFYDWETGSDGVPFRWSERFASLFVPSDVRRVEIPVKVPAELRIQPPLEVDLVVGGVFQNRAPVLGSWTTLVVNLPDTGPASPVRRIDLRADHTWQQGVYLPGSADMRSVAIQVGAPAVFR
jgi:putative inorganic carbon (hco3(-)) transporter